MGNSWLQMQNSNCTEGGSRDKLSRRITETLLECAGKELGKKKLSWDSNWPRAWRVTRTCIGKTKGRVRKMWTRCWLSWGTMDKRYITCWSTQGLLCLSLYWQGLLPIPGPSQAPGPSGRICRSQVLPIMEEEWADDNLKKLDICIQYCCGSWPMSLQGCLISSLKGHGDQGKFLMTGKNVSQPSSRRLRKRIVGTTGQSASYQSPGKLWSESFLKSFSSTWRRRAWLGTVSVELSKQDMSDQPDCLL